MKLIDAHFSGKFGQAVNELLFKLWDGTDRCLVDIEIRVTRRAGATKGDGDTRSRDFTFTLGQPLPPPQPTDEEDCGGHG